MGGCTDVNKILVVSITECAGHLQSSLIRVFRVRNLFANFYVLFTPVISFCYVNLFDVYADIIVHKF